MTLSTIRQHILNAYAVASEHNDERTVSFLVLEQKLWDVIEYMDGEPYPSPLHVYTKVMRAYQHALSHAVGVTSFDQPHITAMLLQIVGHIDRALEAVRPSK